MSSLNTFEVNGVVVVTFYPATHTLDDFIKFDDGSYIDIPNGVRTNWGQAAEAGITPNSAVEFETEKRKNDHLVVEEKSKRFSQSFPGKVLLIRQAPNADISVNPNSQAEQITVTILGIPQELDEYRTELIGNTVEITGPENFEDENVRISSSAFGSQMVFNNVSINGVKQKRKATVRIEVEVPAGTEVKLDGLWVNAIIGDIEAPISIYSMDGDTTVGKVTAADLEIRGVGSVTVKEVVAGPEAGPSSQGKVSASLRGMGSVDIQAGSVSRLSCEVRGMGNIHFGGTAATADLEVRGMGNISVNRVTGSIRESKRGMGSISVSHRS